MRQRPLGTETPWGQGPSAVSDADPRGHGPGLEGMSAAGGTARCRHSFGRSAPVGAGRHRASHSRVPRGAPSRGSRGLTWPRWGGAGAAPSSQVTPGPRASPAAAPGGGERAAAPVLSLPCLVLPCTALLSLLCPARGSSPLSPLPTPAQAPQPHPGLLQVRPAPSRAVGDPLRARGLRREPRPNPRPLGAVLRAAGCAPQRRRAGRGVLVGRGLFP